MLFRIVCECDREVSTEQIEITIGDYEAARRSSTAFIIVPGHADLSFERIISIRAERYEIVEKPRRRRPGCRGRGPARLSEIESQ